MNTKSLRSITLRLTLPSLLITVAACGGGDTKKSSPSTEAPATGDPSAPADGAGASTPESGDKADKTQGSDGGDRKSDDKGDKDGKDSGDGDQKAQLVSACQKGCPLVVAVGCDAQADVDDCKSSCDDVPQRLVDGCFDEMLAFTECLNDRPATAYECNADGFAVLSDISNSVCADKGRAYVACSDKVFGSQ